MLSMPSTYPYRPLSNPGDFRLLLLLPESYAAQKNLDPNGLYGILGETNPKYEAPYDCLSYAWGTKHETHVLWLDGHKIAIGENLDLALRALRYEDKPHGIWVDFVCINQNDLKEREEQVKIMFDIYRGAARVVAYLGGAADGSERFLDLYVKIHQANAAAKRSDSESGDRTFHFMTGELHGLPPFDSDEWNIVGNVLLRPWFSRVWIIQEALAAKELHVVCGHWVLAGQPFFRTFDIMNARGLPVFSQQPTGEREWNVELASQHVQRMLEYMKVSTGLHPERPRRPHLMDQLALFRRARSTDPRDQVFALLNLCQDGTRPEVQPNYAEDVCETYMRVARYLLENGRGDELICNALMTDSDLALPSWVPDWSAEGVPFRFVGGLPLKNHDPSNFPCAGGKETSFQFTDDPQELRVAAVLIGEIETLGIVLSTKDNVKRTWVDQEIDRAEACETTSPKNSEESASDRRERLTKELIHSLRPSFVTTEQGVEREQAQKPCSPLVPSPEAQPKWPVLYRIVRELESFVLASPAYPAASKRDIVWRTTICNQIINYTRPIALMSERHCEAYLQHTKLHYDRKSALNLLAIAPFLQQQAGNGAEVAQRWLLEQYELGTLFEQAGESLCHELRTAVMRCGKVGRVPHRTEVGDVVAVMRGVRVPMVLRRAGPGRFKIVGQAYVYGFMHGEAFESTHHVEETILLV